ncbi:MAG: hypothetical protein HY528_01405 [Chloroflexi bacterium]|nr:hypothetical protein [Chloroflexota bacterium]
MSEIEIKVDEALIKRMYQRFRIEKKDLELLHEFGERLGPVIGQIADKALQHILSFPECAAVFKGEPSKQKMLAGETAHLAKLFSGALDEEFFGMGFHIGLVHGALDIEPAWYLSCYAIYMDEFLRWLASPAQHISPEQAFEINMVLYKIMTLDISLAWEAYYRQREQKIRDSYQALEASHNLSLRMIEQRDREIEELLKTRG